MSLTVYRWGPPPDAAAVARSVAQTAQGEVDAVLFTSAPGAAEWLATARRQGALEAIVERAAGRRLLLAAVGPITAGPLLNAGADPLIAERGRLGSLVRAVVTHFGGGSAPSLDTAAGRLELRSTAAVLDGHALPLSRASLSLLRALFEARGGVVARAELAASLPRSGGAPSDSAHAVDVAIARTRDALGIPTLIRTVVKRGYRLEVASPEGPA